MTAKAKMEFGVAVEMLGRVWCKNLLSITSYIYIYIYKRIFSSYIDKWEK